MHAGKHPADRDHAAEHRRARRPAPGRQTRPPPRCRRPKSSAGSGKLWPRVSLGKSGREAERSSYGRGRLMALRSTLPATKTTAGTSTSPGKSGLRCQSSQPSSPAVQNVHRRHRPGARDAQRPPRRRPRPEPAEHCVVLFGLHPSAPSLLFISAYHPLPGLSNQGRGRYNRAWNLELSVETVAALCAPQAGEREFALRCKFLWLSLFLTGYGAQSAATFSIILETSS